MIRILFTGGGTGGHIYPIVAVAEEIKNIASEKNIDLEMRYFGVPRTYGSILEKEGIGVSKILSSKLRRYLDVMNLVDAPKFILSLFQLLWKVFWFMPDVLFSKGGPGALAVVLVSWFYRIPIIIHESDTVPGLTNQISARYAKRIAVAFESAKDFFSGNVAWVGNPVRKSLLQISIDASKAKNLLGFKEDKSLICFMGGSQGASRINDFVMDVLPQLIKDYQIIHQTGMENFGEIKREFDVLNRDLTPEEKIRYRVVSFFDNNYKEVLTASDIVISRAGSSSIFELAIFGKPSILVPLPEAAGDHQTKNAYEYAKFGAAVVIESDNLTPNIFITQLKKILSDPGRLKSMSEAAKKFAKPEAARVIAEEIINLVMANQ